MKNNPYSILNKKYSEKDYKKISAKIIKHMRKTGEYGEYFPHNLSPFGYNETVAAFYMPLSKDEVIKKGWHWEDNTPGTFNKQTLNQQQIPDNIADTKDSITKKVLACDECNRNYKIIDDELEFYRRQIIPIPRLCSECRYLKRMQFRQPRKLWSRECASCSKEIKAPYIPERKEKAYCE